MEGKTLTETERLQEENRRLTERNGAVIQQNYELIRRIIEMEMELDGRSSMLVLGKECAHTEWRSRIPWDRNSPLIGLDEEAGIRLIFLLARYPQVVHLGVTMWRKLITMLDTDPESNQGPLSSGDSPLDPRGHTCGPFSTSYRHPRDVMRWTRHRQCTGVWRAH